MRRWMAVGLLAVGLPALAACGGGAVTTSDGTSVAVDALPGEKAPGGLETTASGLQTVVLRAGDGPQAATGQRVQVRYAGYLLDGTKFDATAEGGAPYTFVLGQGAVIAGWEEAVAMMKVGEKRKLVIPPALGYGAQGYPPVIPADATLVFDVELVGAE
ncbi:peptidylprolyl isomerase [bacterium]|nr:MAG: peptidylprolyl isomerase [bacterium]